jgi:hypothetical protein
MNHQLVLNNNPYTFVEWGILSLYGLFLYKLSTLLETISIVAKESTIDVQDITIPEKGWTLNIEKSNQDMFIEKTLQSKFALAPRGYGKSSFRFFEIFQLGCIPIYVWDDIEWLPYKELIDYSSVCISIHVTSIDELPNKLRQIDEEKYNTMRTQYKKIQHLFELEFMCNYITRDYSPSPSS